MLAEGILKLHWNQSVPVDVARIAQGMGVALDYSENLGVCAHLQVSLQNQARLTLCQQHGPALQRYATAQALGHVALHHLRPGLERQIVVTEDFLVDENSRSAREAQQFALRLLMPEAVLRYCVQEMALQDLLELADIFDVPPTLMGWRLLHWQVPSSA